MNKPYELHPNIQGGTFCSTAEEAYAKVLEIYNQNSQNIRDAFTTFAERHAQDEELTLLELEALKSLQGTYPYVGITVQMKDLCPDSTLSFGIASEPGIYGTTLTRPDVFKDYYLEQFNLLIQHHKTPLIVGSSTAPIPLPFLKDYNPGVMGLKPHWQLQLAFALPDLTRVDDHIANCRPFKTTDYKPMALFSGERVDYSLQRLHHYTGTSPEHFQGFILLTNYQRYVDEFVSFSYKQLELSDEYEAFVEPGDCITYNPRLNLPEHIQSKPLYPPQMPAYHLKRKDGNGITFINIGVGPTNAKNITDHLAVLRPHCWIMLGHCAGLRRTQALGDYVLAHGYLRDDHVLDTDLPTSIPVPPIAEIQVALQKAVGNVLGLSNREVRKRMRTGTVATTDDRNWELRTSELYERFNQSRSIALDMESATIAANGFRFRVPYGTLLCISDKPIHGEIKLRGSANSFYAQSINQHLKVGLEAVRLLRENGVSYLHSRKLRGFDEPLFR